jgi:GNAT superfamily N-acetyltransferase
MTPSELFFTLNETLDSGGRILICRRDEKAVGILIYSVFEDLMTYNLLGYIELVFVMPHFRGKGVGKKQLLSFATKDLSGKGVDETFFECVFESDYNNWSKAVGMSEFSILLEKSAKQ